MNKKVAVSIFETATSCIDYYLVGNTDLLHHI